LAPAAATEGGLDVCLLTVLRVAGGPKEQKFAFSAFQFFKYHPNVFEN
jgi:hypothetical protein